jgi:hypothetical protein
MSLCYDFQKKTIIAIALVAVLNVTVILSPVFGEELKILETQLNENSISGILVNEYDYPISGIIVRAEFYDKEDGHLVGVRDIGWSSKDPLGPKEESSYKIPEFEDVEGQGPFPNTNFIVKAQGYHDTTAEEVEEGEGNRIDDLIEKINKLEQGYKNATKAIEEYKENARELNLNLTGKDNKD